MTNNENAKGTFRKFLDGFKRLIKRGNKEELSTARETEGEETGVAGGSLSPEESETFLIDKALESIQYYDRLDVMKAVPKNLHCQKVTLVFLKKKN